MNQKSNPQQYDVSFHILTPVHIGSGTEIDPFSYIIRDGQLHIINLVDWIADYPEKEELLSLMEKDSFSAIRTFIANHYKIGSHDRVSIPVDTPQLLADYDKAIRLQNAANQVLVNSMTRNEVDGFAYIPGSSIKGAIRTAIANRFVEQAGIKKDDGKKRNWETSIFGQIREDPLRYLKLSDISLKEHGTCIVEAKEYTKDKNKSLTPKGSKECAVNLCRNLESIKYSSRMILEPDKFVVKIKQVTTKMDINFLIESLNLFYVQKYIDEYNKFYKDVSEEVEDSISPASLAIASLKSNEALIRVGQHSHVECMTLDKVRNPRTPKGKYGETRTLANGLYPFGWCKLEFHGIESNLIGNKALSLKALPFTVDELESRVRKLKDARLKDIKQKQEQELALQKKEKQREIEEENRRTFESMTPEEQLLAKFSNNNLSENEMNDIFNNIQNYAADYRKKIAEQLKSYWQEKKQWSKNDVSKKKWKTVRERNDAIEAIILG